MELLLSLSKTMCNRVKGCINLFIIGINRINNVIIANRITIYKFVPISYALKIATMPMIGANTITVRNSSIKICICVMSLFVMVIREDFDMSFISWFEKVKTFLNNIFLKSLAYPEENLLEMKDTVIEVIVASTVIVNIIPPL